MSAFTVAGTIVNIFERSFFTGEVVIEDGKIAAIKKLALQLIHCLGLLYCRVLQMHMCILKALCWYRPSLQN
jgi:adenine deaminase